MSEKPKWNTEPYESYHRKIEEAKEKENLLNLIEKDKEILEVMKFIGMFHNTFLKCFNRYMEKKPKYGETWKTCKPQILQDKLTDQISKYSGNPDDLVDVINLSMMLLERWCVWAETGIKEINEATEAQFRKKG